MGSLSSLPDDLLVKILSSLPTKQAASTSVLSKRWRTLYTPRDSLDFDDSHHKNGTNINEIQKSFRDFVDTTLALHQGTSSSVKKLSLNCQDDHHDVARVDTWICNAVDLGVSELHLSIRTRFFNAWRRLFPSKLFTSKTLVKLSLGTCRAIQGKGFPSDTSLPSLKSLFFDRIRFDSQELSNVVLPACPLLEELTVNHDSFPGMKYVISSKTVKRLSLTNRTASDVDWRSFVTLDTPSVVELYFSDLVVRKFQNCDLDSLEKATLDLHLADNIRLRAQLDPDVSPLMNAIRNVKTLCLTSSAVEVLLVCCKSGLPVFDSLVDLKFSSKTEQGWKVFLPRLIRSAPNLETLVLSDTSCAFAGDIGSLTNNRGKKLRIIEEVRTR